MTPVASAKRPKRSKNRLRHGGNTPETLNTYEEALDWLQGHYNLEKNLGGDETTAPSLERMTILMELLGNPHKDIPAVHVTGTNGKGSVCFKTAQVLQNFLFVSICYKIFNGY